MKGAWNKRRLINAGDKGSDLSDQCTYMDLKHGRFSTQQFSSSLFSQSYEHRSNLL